MDADALNRLKLTASGLGNRAVRDGFSEAEALDFESQVLDGNFNQVYDTIAGREGILADEAAVRAEVDASFAAEEKLLEAKMGALQLLKGIMGRPVSLAELEANLNQPPPPKPAERRLYPDKKPDAPQAPRFYGI